MQRCHVVQVGNVHCHELHTLHGDDTIELYFSHQYFCGQGGNFAGVVDSVTPYRETHLVGFCLFGSDQAYKLPVRDIFHAVSVYLVLEDELDSVGRVLYAPSDAICQLPKFVGCQQAPCFFVFWAVH